MTVNNELLKRVKRKENRRLWDMAPRLCELFEREYNRLSDSVTDEDCDEDDIFEELYSACLEALPQETDEDLALASMLNAYLEAIWNEQES